ncbi:MAG TPA: glycosyltransferase family 2 protein, partial [Balneolales bacterium]|nr:glycosyltransferase family 2 protein [Balneolales bacterium]
MSRPRVSIGMPVYNGENYIERAISSILAQTYKDFELIISDNASTDKTQEICKMFVGRDNRVRYHRNSKNIGAARNYNIVFRLSRGKYFKWAAHDDELAPAFLEDAVNVLEKNKDV